MPKSKLDKRISTYATSFLVANMFTLQMLSKLTKRINPLMLPLSTLRFNMNNIITSVTPTTASTGMMNSPTLEHLLHLDVPKTVLNPSAHLPHAIPPLPDKQ